jgi:hypothetical protein
LGLALAQNLPVPTTTRKSKPKGPRALGLLQLSPSGKARLIPVTILYDGEFYDAGAYKAAPVPMALESGTVYEALRSGVSQGLFTVSSALQANHSWIGQGTWQSARELAAAAAKRKAAPAKPAAEKEEGPPVLRRGAAEKPKPPEPEPAATKPAPAPASTSPAPGVPAKPSVEVAEEDDSNRPVLRRGAPPPDKEKKEPEKSAAAPAKEGQPKSAPTAAAASSSLQLIPAISDADGPDPQPYNYDFKPEDEQKVRTRMLALAAEEVRARAAQLAAEVQPATGAVSRAGAKTKPPQPSFQNVQLRAFDLSNSNEPTLVLSAKARMPDRPGAPNADLQYLITLVAREDIYGEVHKAFVGMTDTQHLDVLPRMELIDAVDADGDGRGELLFRQTSDAGSAFVVYRVIGDQLWPLFQGTPGE